MNRTDAEYSNLIQSVDAQCAKISKAKFAWKPDSGNDSATNWQNFGIPDCSGNADAARCGNNMCEMSETAQSCPSDCGGTGGACSGYTNETSCKTTSGCSWTVMSSGYYGGYCASTSTNWTPQCSDSKDNDSDGKTDYPNDSGCYDKMDDMESDNVGGESGMRRCFYPNAKKDGVSPGYTVWCEADYVNCHKGDPSGETVSTSGLSLGAPSQCESGLSNDYTIGSECRSKTSSSICSAVSGCYWYTGYSGGYCDSGGSATPSGGGCGMYTTESTCKNMSACRWESNACMPITTSSTSCPSGQYWSGSSCVTSTTGGSGGGCGMYTSESQCKVMSDWKWESNACMPTTSTTSGSSCYGGSYSSQSSCQAAGCTWYANHHDGTHCDDTAHGSSGSGGGSGYGMCGSYTTQPTCTLVTNCKWYTSSGSRGTSYCYYQSGTSSSSSCPSGQYWNGSSCVNTSTTDCTSGQYWNGTSCQTSSTSSGSYEGPSGSSLCSDGIDNDSDNLIDAADSSCQSTSSTSSSCPSGQYWSGSACVNNPTSSTMDYSTMQASCTSAGGTWSSTSNYCMMPPTSSPSSTSCSSGQYWDGSACVTSHSAPPSTPTCGSGEYWNGSACQSSSSSTTSSPPPSPTTSTSCSSGQYWDGSACVNNPTSPTP